MPLSWVLKPLAVASAVAFSTLGLLSTRYQKARFYWNSVLFLATLGWASVCGLCITFYSAAAGNRLNINYYVARSFYQVAHRLVGIDFDVEGEEHLTNLLTARDGKPQSAVVLGNHQSMIDILYLGRIFPKQTAITAKQELKWSPLLGQYMALSGAVFINRKNRKDAVAAMQQVGVDMKKKGVSLWIFPEGTRYSHEEPTLLPFKKGAFHLAIQAQAPIVLVVCENYNRLFDGQTRFDGGRLKIKILPPISTVGLTSDDVHSLVDSTRDLMLKTLKEISLPAPARAPSVSTAITNDAKVTPIPEKTEESVAPEGVRQRVVTVPTPTASTDSLPSREETTTEDEMDDDAVLLKRPKTEA